MHPVLGFGFSGIQSLGLLPYSSLASAFQTSGINIFSLIGLCIVKDTALRMTI
jgi:hypothetical protein